MAQPQNEEITLKSLLELSSFLSFTLSVKKVTVTEIVSFYQAA